jgi:tol-pal system protein YbgF
MTRTRTLLGCTILIACLAAPGFAFAQQSGGLLGNLFGGNDQTQPAPQPPAAIGSQGGGGGSGVDSRIDRIENSLRQLTGQIEVLQHQNQMLEMQLKRMQDGSEYRSQQMGRGGAPMRGATPDRRSQAAPPMQTPNIAAAAPSPGAPLPAPSSNQPVASAGQGDAFNPALHPNAPGAPRSLGGGMPGPVATQGGMNQGGMNRGMNEAPVGAPGGREAGAPLDLTTLAGDQPAAMPAARANPAAAGNMPAGQLPPPPPRNPSATGAQIATLPPAATPKDEYELAYGYVLHRDYGLAAQAFRDFLGKYPKDHLVPDAHYWLGESLFQQQNYDDAARAFLAVSTKYKHFSKAPDALLRLGQSLAALHHKEAACATLSEVKNKFPHASSAVKRGVAKELKRVHC